MHISRSTVRTALRLSNNNKRASLVSSLVIPQKHNTACNCCACQANVRRSFAVNFKASTPLLQQQEQQQQAILSNFSEPDQSFHNISVKPFSETTQKILMEPVSDDDVEIKPDGILYLPEIKYRRILNRAFGPGAWGLMPRGIYHIDNGSICQQFALFCNGQFVSQAWGDQAYDESMSHKSLASALEGVKSNALMRCCKDLGIASELWDPSFILKWKAEHGLEVWAVHVKTNQRKKLYRRKDRPAFEYPYSEEKAATSASSSSSGASSVKSKAKSAEPAAFSVETDIVDQPRPATLEDGDVDMFDMFNLDTEAATKKKDTPTSFDWSETIKFGKFSGQTWEQAMSQPTFKGWAKWMVAQGKAPHQVKAALQMLEEKQ